MLIKDAMVCLDCDRVFDLIEGLCPCGSRTVVPLSTWLNPLPTKRLAVMADRNIRRVE